MWETVVGGLIAVVGGVVGALLSHRLSRSESDRRQKADDDRRWMADRRHLYASYMASIQRFYEHVQPEVRALDRLVAGTPEDRVENLRRLMPGLEQRLLEVSNLGSEVALIAGVAVCEELNGCAWATREALPLFVKPELASTGDEYLAQLRWRIKSCGDAMRADLGMAPRPSDEREVPDHLLPEGFARTSTDPS